MLALLFEAGVLARTPRSGPYQVGVTTQETIAAHSYRHVLLAYFLAHAEGADAGKAVLMAMVADLPEARTLDLTFVQKRYLSLPAGEGKVLADQLRGLPGASQLEELHAEYQAGSSAEAKVARDADILEALVEARELASLGAKPMERWFLGKREQLHTPAARKLFDRLKRGPVAWWTE